MHWIASADWWVASLGGDDTDTSMSSRVCVGERVSGLEDVPIVECPVLGGAFSGWNKGGIWNEASLRKGVHTSVLLSLVVIHGVSRFSTL